MSQHLSLDSGGHSVRVKVHQKAYALVAELQVRQQLSFVDGQNGFDCLEFKNNFVFTRMSSL